MFSTDQITETTIGRITEHYGLLNSQGDIPELRRAVALLIDIANNENISPSDEEIANVIDATKHILNLLFRTPFSERRLPIPETFWNEPNGIGPVLYHVRTWLNRNLVNYTDAAAILNDTIPHNQAAAVAVIRRKVQQGKFVGFVDPFESNPQHAKRVRQSAVKVYRRHTAMQQNVVA